MCTGGGPLLKEHNPEILYIKDIDNTVTDATSRLDYNSELHRHADDEKIGKGTKWNNFLKLLNHYKTKDSDGENSNYDHNYNQVFANNQSDSKIYPLTIAEIADAQRSDHKWKQFFKEDHPKEKIVQW